MGLFGPKLQPPTVGPTHLSGRVCVVTGSNGGIGKEIAAGLVGEGAEVVLACRSMEKCERAKAEIESRGLSGTCRCSQLDVDDPKSIREFVRREKRELQGRPLSILVNNAGVMGSFSARDVWPGLTSGPTMTPPEVWHPSRDPHVGPNHLGPFLLTLLLLPSMRPGSRVVTVASEAHRRAPPLGLSQDTPGAILDNPSGWYKQYARSKLLNVMMTGEVQRRAYADGRGVSATSVSPGRVASNIFDSVPGALRPALRWLSQAAFRTPTEGAATALKACLDPQLGWPHSPGALYMHDLEVVEASEQARDVALQRRLWDVSEFYVGESLGELPRPDTVPAPQREPVSAQAPRSSR
ncbi:unnamed protein product [Pedinophyceae sp. YPF-701]|nr:unnamed protein product [Pedinophyceae sp. YPF-701]